MLSDAPMQKECRKCKVVFPRRDLTKRMPSLCPVCIAIVPHVKILTCKKCKIDLPPQGTGRKKQHCFDCHKIYLKETKRKIKTNAKKKYSLDKLNSNFQEMPMIQRVPVKPLLDYFKSIHFDDSDWASNTSTADKSLTAWMAEKLGVAPSYMTYYVASKDATISVWLADKFAIRLRLHPLLIWGTSFYAFDLGATKRKKAAYERAKAKGYERRINILLQQGYSRESITDSGHLRKRALPVRDDQS
jgi:hypothetical protein